MRATIRRMRPESDDRRKREQDIDKQFEELLSGVMRPFIGLLFTDRVAAMMKEALMNKMGNHLSKVDVVEFRELVESPPKDLVIHAELMECSRYLLMYPKSKMAIKYAKKRQKEWNEWLRKNKKTA